MLRPSDLVETASLLASARDGSPTDADLRRCVSTADYAVFHAVLKAGADRFFGAVRSDRGGYGLLYRAYDHGRMKRSCDDISRSKLTPAH